MAQPFKVPAAIPESPEFSPSQPSIMRSVALFWQAGRCIGRQMYRQNAIYMINKSLKKNKNTPFLYQVCI